MRVQIITNGRDLRPGDVLKVSDWDDWAAVVDVVPTLSHGIYRASLKQWKSAGNIFAFFEIADAEQVTVLRTCQQGDTNAA